MNVLDVDLKEIKGNEKIVDGYTYVNSNRYKDRQYVVCKRSRIEMCKGRGKYEKEKFTLLHKHNHSPDDNAEVLFLFKQALKKKCMTSFGTARSIYNLLRILHLEASELLSFNDIEPTMNNWLRCFAPPKPNNLLHFGELLQNDPWQQVLSYSIGSLDCDILISDENLALLFINTAFISEIGKVDKIFVDATFKTSPNIPGCSQLLTVMTKSFDHIIPIAWALMSNRNKDSYRIIFEKLKLKCADHFEPSMIMTDYEMAIHVAAKSVFTQSEITGCWFHYCQAILRKARMLQIPNVNNRSSETFIIIKKFMALALLPAEEIPRAVQMIHESIPPELLNDFETFIVYFNNQWMNRVKPSTFSVYGKTDRTNGAMESLHKRYIDLLETKQIADKFTKNLCNLQEITHLDFRQLKLGKQVYRTPRNKKLVKESKINYSWFHYSRSKDLLALFIRCTNLVGQCANNISYIEDQFPGLDAEEYLLMTGSEPTNIVQTATNQLNAESTYQDLTTAEVSSEIVGDSLTETEAVSTASSFDYNNWEYVNDESDLDDDAGIVQPDLNELDIEIPEFVEERTSHSLPEPNFNERRAIFATKCVVCGDNGANHAFDPCFCIATCGQCTNNIVRNARTYSFTDNGTRYENPKFNLLTCPMCNRVAANVHQMNMPTIDD